MSEESFLRFNGLKIVREDSKEAVLKLRLKGFNPRQDTAEAEVKNDILYITATMDGEDYVLKINKIGVKIDDDSLKPSDEEIEVTIKKLNPEYSLADKLPKD